MKDATADSMHRELSSGSLLGTVFVMQARQLAIAAKTRALLAIQLLPVLGVFAYVIFEQVDGLAMFTGIVERVTFPFLIPLAAIFFGGPAIVDEMEGRTLTFLTLRPVGKGTLFLGKVFAGMVVAVAVVVVPILLLFLIALWQSGDYGAMLESLGFILLGATLGTAAYVAIFAALGAAFASSLMPSIIYWVVFEFAMGMFPVLELLSVRYWTRTTSQLTATPGWLDQLILEEPMNFDWWIGLVVVSTITGIAIGVGAWIFRERQYVV